ncbi:hypothetical protein KJ616_01390 [Patescibacteria group bacterium]|nr:hypothetical protein [Patescibacteria group bacterium]
MKKKFYFFLVLGFFVLVIVGVLLWLGLSEDTERVTPGVKFEAPKYYVIKDGPDGKIVENKHAGINLKAPAGWEVEKREIGPDEWIVNFNSPDLTTDEAGFLATGCGFSIWIEYDKTTADIVRNSIQDPEKYSASISGRYDVLGISGHQSLRTIFDKKGWGKIVGIEIPKGEMIYRLDTVFLPDEEGKCSEFFDKFLDNIFIY